MTNHYDPEGLLPGLDRCCSCGEVALCIDEFCPRCRRGMARDDFLEGEQWEEIA